MLGCNRRGTLLYSGTSLFASRVPNIFERGLTRQLLARAKWISQCICFTYTISLFIYLLLLQKCTSLFLAATNRQTQNLSDPCQSFNGFLFFQSFWHQLANPFCQQDVAKLASSAVESFMKFAGDEQPGAKLVRLSLA